MMRGFFRIDEFAKQAGLSVGTLYQYSHRRLYGFPEPDVTVGIVKFWRARTAKAWIRKHKAGNRR